MTTTTQATKVHYAVAVYDTWRAYGGPEEGGWWFTAGELDRVDAVLTDEAAAGERCRDLNATLGDRQQAAHIVELPRREHPFESERCHMEDDVPESEYLTRWDIPTHFPERPHYC